MAFDLETVSCDAAGGDDLGAHAVEMSGDLVIDSRRFCSRAQRTYGR